MLVVGAAVVGAAGAPWGWARLGHPSSPGAAWTMIVPGTDDALMGARSFRTSGVIDGALLLPRHPFGRSDTLVPVDKRPVATVDVELAADSGPMQLNIVPGAGSVIRLADLRRGGWRPRPDAPWQACGDVVRVELGSPAKVCGVAVGAAAGSIEAMATAEPVRIRALALYDATGQVLVASRFDALACPDAIRALAAVVAGVWAALTLLAMGERSLLPALTGAVALGALPAMVLASPFSLWRQLAETLRLATTPPGDLKASALALSTAPLLAAALLQSGVLDVGVGPGSVAAPIAVAAAVAFLASLSTPLAFVPGLAVLLIPTWTARRAGLSPRAVLLRDLPALAMVAVGGWPALLPALAWRMLALWADVPVLLERNPRAGTEALLLTALAMLPAAEVAARATVLDRAWSPESIAGASVGVGASSRELTPFWQDSCGDRAVYALGGSSTGGAWQYSGDPGAFFPTVLHRGLCAAGLGVHTLNLGDSGRDSFDMAHGVGPLFAAQPPAVVIVYAGVNDLLTAESPLTRKERAAALAERTGASRGLDAIGSRSRVISGLGLLFRPATIAGPSVAAVPVADAEENLRAVAAAASPGRVLLVPEYATGAVGNVLDAYWAMERRLAAELDNVDFLDSYAALGDPDRSGLLADRNHLSPEGSRRLAAWIQPQVEALLR